MPLARGAKAASTMNQRHKRKAAAKVRVENNELPASGREQHETESLFAAEAAYADSIFRTALGDSQGCIDALRCSLEFMPTYAPALLSLGTTEYQLGHRAKGWNLFMKLFALPDDTKDLCVIIDKAGDFLIRLGRYEDGIALYRRAASRFPGAAVLHQGLGCCAGHQGLHGEAISASRAALALEPDNQKFVNDLGWSLYQAGSIEEARTVLERAAAMDKTDKLAAENLRICMSSGKRDHRRRVAG
jgi:tetratricopeptide (TPR) repeat protein